MNRFKQLYGITLTNKLLHEIVFVLMAFEVIFAFSYLGYIELPTVSSTTLHVIVIVAAMILGSRGSVPVVCVFAFTSMWIATYSTSALDQLFSPFISGAPVRSLTLVLARIAFAVIASALFGLFFRKERKHVYLGISAIAVLSTFIHSFMVFITLYLFFPMHFQAIRVELLSLPWVQDWVSYVSAALACCLVHHILSKEKVKDYLSYLCNNAEAIQEDASYDKALFWAKISAGIIGILCVMYLRNRILSEFYNQGIEVGSMLRIDITAILIQLLFALACLLGIIFVVIRWINEFYVIQRERMSKVLTEQSQKLSVDPLTGVFSRFAYIDTIKTYEENRPQDLVAFLIDINGLKSVNDAKGHEAGDELICGAAQCIAKAFAGKGTTFRIGGDEFVVFANMQAPQVEESKATLKRIVDAWSGKRVQSLSLSVGSALAIDYPDATIEKLVRQADMAMYKEKQEYYQKKLMK